MVVLSVCDLQRAAGDRLHHVRPRSLLRKTKGIFMKIKHKGLWIAGGAALLYFYWKSKQSTAATAASAVTSANIPTAAQTGANAANAANGATAGQ